MKLISLEDYKQNSTSFLSFKNRDGKLWTIPTKEMKKGLEIYEPSSYKGAFLKKCFPLIGKMNLFRFIKYGTINSVTLDPYIYNILLEIFKQFGFSVFWGTPCIDKKITIQIFNNSNILGYCKIGSTSRVEELFVHEQIILDVLEKMRVENVPHCLGLFKIDETTSIFVQDTQKKINSKTCHQFNNSHVYFLNQLYSKTKKAVLFEKTDFFKSLSFLNENIKMIDLKYRDVVLSKLQLVIGRYKNQYVEWGVCHRDFTPWNTCIVENKIYAFDFEYALRFAPEGLDKYHFLIQTYYFESKLNAKQIAKKLKESNRYSIEVITMYLLDNISLYAKRGSKDDIKIVDFKAEILSNI